MIYRVSGALLAAFVLLGLWGGLAAAQTQTPSYKLGASGHFGWIVRYGLGDGRGLAQAGYVHGLMLSQLLSLNLDASVGVPWPAGGLLSLKAALNNQQGGNLQSFRMGLTSQTLDGQFGDFPMGRPDSLFASPQRQLKGFQLGWHPDKRLKISGVLSQVEGLFQSRTFRGNAAHEVIKFSFPQPDRPWLQPPSYQRDLKGLEYYQLGKKFVQGFTQVKLDFSLTEKLKSLLVNYGLGYLQKTIAKDPARPLDQATYRVVFSRQSYYLILQQEAFSLLRDRLQSYIDAYNQSPHGSSAQAQEYPLNEGTEYEKQFLAALSRLVTLKVGTLKLVLSPAGPDQPQGYRRQKFYALGQVKLVESSVVVQIKIDNRFTSVNDPSLPNYSYRVFAVQGLIELDFPSDFFDNPQSVVRVAYDYQAAQGTYLLGLSVLKGSEKVYLNGKLLQAGIDYSISYDNGLLLLLKPIKPSDTLRIDYEVARGGLGGFTEYQRLFSGLRADYQPLPGLKLTLALLQARDGAANVISRDQLKTMPNQHTIVGLSGRLELGTLKGQLDLGYGLDRFPFDDNARRNLPNRINVVRVISLAGHRLVLFGGQNGLTLYDVRAKRWSHYGVGEGLAGPEVKDIAYSAAHRLLIFATNGGLSVLRLEIGRSPATSFAVVRNWKRYSGKEDGLPQGTIHAALIADKTLWLGSDEGLTQVSLDQLDHPKNWKQLRRAQHPELPSDQVLKLAQTKGRLYLGTDQGLAYLDLATGEFGAIPDLAGTRINDLALGEGDTLYVATGVGLRSLSEGVGGGWLMLGQPVISVAQGQGTIWYGTSAGLYPLPEQAPGQGALPATVGHLITAIAAGPEGTVWAGEQATPIKNRPESRSPNYQLLIWQVGPSRTRQYPSAQTGIDARNEHQFSDVPAADHTDYGWISRLSLSQSFGALQLSATLFGISPKYLTIGEQQRQDALRLDLGASYPISPVLSLSADHQESLTGLTRVPTRSIRDSIRLSWAGDPQLQLGYQLSRTDDNPQYPGFDRFQTSYSLKLGQSFLANRLATHLGVTLQDHRLLGATPFTYQELQLNGDLLFRVINGLTLHLNIANPLSFGFAGLRGERRLNWSLDWFRPLSLAGLPDMTLTANYSGTRQTILPFGSGNLAQKGLLSLQLASWQLGPLSLTPQGNLSLDQLTDLRGRGTTRTLGGQASLQGAWGQWSSQLSYQRSAARSSFNQVEQLNDNLSGSLGYAGLPGLNPSLSYSLTLQTLRHPIFGQKQNANDSLSLSLDWQLPDSPLQGSFSLSRQGTRREREKTVDYGLQASWSYQLTPKISPQLLLNTDYTLGTQDAQPVNRLSGELDLRLDWPLPGAWGATFQAGYLFGLDRLSAAGSYQSLTFSAEAGMDFSI
ncbi:MAG TPA: hypothetical protein ENI60_07590 [Candidatus Fraserbacteria bacterium]|nr:hypothetical protein [Candidatus Fraserbacteria bacterium]